MLTIQERAVGEWMEMSCAKDMIPHNPGKAGTGCAIRLWCRMTFGSLETLLPGYRKSDLWVRVR